MSIEDEVVAIVLCGGLGTRLGAMTRDQPKPMVEVAGRPFIERILDNLVEQEISKIVLAVSYLREVIQAHIGPVYRGVPIEYSVEEKPLGTGGAIVNAIRQLNLEHTNLLVVNGDSYCKFDLSGMIRQLPDVDIVMVTKYLHDTGRYGTAQVNSQGEVTDFIEKKHSRSGYINAGIYLFSTSLVAGCGLEKFSFEMTFLEQAESRNIKITTQISDSYFIDIGIVDDYMLANDYFRQHDAVEQ
ncbi:nucleotidyltransferase family protein [Photobacterium lutimaris]|nr:nucleotidyltransferase family protein [Photobacterium lutimaris]TDR78630.1 D-glycero-alpha-D-manno-heptose 1-phosphate guanylyltransferase [Photobacterium lutimaris]